jgi:hypothetical protein
MLEDPFTLIKRYEDSKIPKGKESVDKLIPLGYDLIGGKVKYTEVSSPQNSLFFGRKGSGKSFALQEYLDALYGKGYVHAIFHDLHGEFEEKHKPNETYISDVKRGAEVAEVSDRRFMPHIDKLQPFGWDKEHIRRYTPEFIGKGKGVKLSLSLTALPKATWIDRLGYTNKDRHKRRAFEVFYDLIVAQKAENPGFRITKYFLDDFFNNPAKFLDEKALERVPIDQIREVVSILEVDFIEKKVIEGEYVADLMDVFSTKDDIIFDFSKLDLFSQMLKDDALDPRDIFVTVSICQYFEWVRMQREEFGDKTPYQATLEEMQRILTGYKARGSNRQSMALQSLGLFTTQSRKYGVGLCVALQSAIVYIPKEVTMSFDLVYVSDMQMDKADEGYIRAVFKEYHREFEEFGFGTGRKYHFWVFDTNDKENPVSLIVPYPNRSKKSKERIVKSLKLGSRFDKEDT